MKGKIRIKPIISILLIVCILMPVHVPKVYAASGQTSTYANVYQLATITDATVIGGADVPFSNNGPISGISHTAGTTTISIPSAGNYKIDYNVSITAGAGAALAIAVNGTVIPSTVIPVLTATGEVSGSAILPLNAGDTITLRNNSAAALTLASAPSAGAQMSIVEVSGTLGNVYQWATTDTTIIGGSDVPFSNNGQLSGISHTAGNTTINIPSTGNYKIDYNASITAGVGAALAIAVNGSVISSTVISVLVTTGEVSESVILPLNAGDTITLRNNSLVPLTLASAPSAGAQMSITQVSETAGNVNQLATIADATVTGGADVPFSSNGQMSGISHDAGTTTIRIPYTGYYKINYNASITAGIGAALAVAVNGTVVPSTAILVLTATGEVSGSSILSLNAGDIITLRNNSATALTLTLSPSTGAQMSVVPLSVNIPPAIATNAGSASFFAGDNTASTPVPIDSGVTVTDLGCEVLASSTVAITGNFHSGEDVLAFANTSSVNFGNIVGSYNAATGVMTLVSPGSTATVAQWQNALESVTYNNTAVTPNNSTRTISFTAVDGIGNTSNTATRSVTVSDTDQTPIVTTSNSSTIYTAGGSAVVIDSSVTVSDLDDTTQAAAIVCICSGFHSGDTLSFTNTSSVNFGNIVGSYNAATGVMTLTSSGATATNAQWGKALSSVVFVCSTNTSADARIISFTINDGTKISAAADDTVAVAAVPSITSVNPANGSESGGTSVSITGTGFTGATDVKFGSNPAASYSVTNDTSITATSPAGSGTVDVRITTPSGTSAVVPSDKFTYTPNQDQAAPTGLTGITPTTAANNDGKITGVNDNMEYRLHGAASFTSVATSATEITGLAAGTYQVRYKAKSGFNAGATVDVIVSANCYTVGISTLTGGTITASPTSAASGSIINLVITPNSGMELKAGSLKYNDGSNHSITGTSFIMPSANVIVSALFEAIPNDNHENSASGGTTITGSVINGATGTHFSNLTATITTNSNGTYGVSMRAAQTVALQQPDGTISPLGNLSKLAFVSAAGPSVAVSSDGTINLSNLAKGTNNSFKITYGLGSGQTITIGTLEVIVSISGAVSLTSTLIDPYGIITDAATGKPIAGANITLHYANTERNKTHGKMPDTIVTLPGIDGFKPNNNQNPQISDANGAYGFMVYPDTDYYIVTSREGYEKYTSPTISVDQEIVHWDFKMNAAINGISRLAGQSRVDTALAIAKANYKGTLSNVILTTADNYPDALAGSVIAYKLNAPILMVGSSQADQAKVLDYLTANLSPSGTVYILGGTAVVSTAMENKITASGFTRIIRLGGINRYETSVKIADQLEITSGTPIVLVYGENYPDALSISSISAQMQYPILLVQKDGLSDAVKNKIAAIKPSKVYIIGGEGVISSMVESQVKQITSLSKTNIVRIAGGNRYETSLAITQYFNLSGQSICIATGNNFPDALAGSVYAANHNTSIILIEDNLSDQVVNYLKNKKTTGAVLFGGEAVISKHIEQQLDQLIRK